MGDTYQIQNRGLYFTDYQGKVHLGHKATIKERISEPFIITATIASSTFDAASQLGQQITLNWCEIVDDKQKEKRTFNGYITEIEQLNGQSEDDFQYFKITLKPWYWLLTLRKNYRVFQQQSLSAILSSVFDDAGFSGRYTLSNLPKDERLFCVQYNETDFDFVNRLLAEQGVHFYFTHTSSSHQLCLHNPDSPYPDSTVKNLEYSSQRTASNYLVKTWQPKLMMHSNSVENANYNYESAQTVKSSAKKTAHTQANATKLVLSEFGNATITGSFDDISSTVATNALNKMQSDYAKVYATSGAEDLAIATQFSLTAHPDDGQLGKYAIEAITHTITASEQAISYENYFICRPSDALSYPKFIAKPQIHGLQSATVVGQEQGQPEHDKQARVKVQFHWDQVGGDSPSCWVRAIQTMASSSLGMQFIPRVGDEVLISFVNNDPDQPIIVGSAYNKTNPPPYPTLNSTQSGIKTQLGETANELRFDDKKDAEEVYIHAAKDFNVAVENNLVSTVQAEQQTTVEKSITLTGNENLTTTIKSNISTKADNITLEAGTKMTFKVGSNSIEISTSGIKIDCTKLDISASGAISVDGASLSLSSNAATSISAGSNFSASANANAELKGSAGVTVSSTAQAKVTGSAGAELSSSALTKVSSSGITQVSGSLVQVN